MIVTVNTDASFHPVHKVGAYAFWVVCNQGKILKSGRLKNAKNSTDAEAMAIANALYSISISDFTGITKIIINSDCLPAIQKIKSTAKEPTAYKYCYNVIKKIRIKNGITGRRIHEFRHVKAHSGTKEPRKWVNDWCDKEAKKHMRLYVSEILKKEHKMLIKRLVT